VPHRQRQRRGKEEGGRSLQRRGVGIIKEYKDKNTIIIK